LRAVEVHLHQLAVRLVDHHFALDVELLHLRQRDAHLALDLLHHEALVGEHLGAEEANGEAHDVAEALQVLRLPLDVLRLLAAVVEPRGVGDLDLTRGRDLAGHADEADLLEPFLLRVGQGQVVRAVGVPGAGACDRFRDGGDDLGLGRGGRGLVGGGDDGAVEQALAQPVAEDGGHHAAVLAAGEDLRVLAARGDHAPVAAEEPLVHPGLHGEDLVAQVELAQPEALIPPGGPFPLGAGDVGTAERLARYLQRMAPETQGQVRLLLRAWEAAPLASRHLRCFSRLAPAARDAWVERCLASRLPWRRIPLLLLKTLCLSAFCADPRVEAALGYGHECLDGRAPGAGPRLVPLQYPDVRGDVEEVADVCVVGSGAGGAVVAYELARAGLRVVVLEEGGYFTQADFTGPPMERVQRFYRNGGATVALGRPTIPVPLGKCVGGTTVVNSGTCFRTPERVLREWASAYGVADADPTTMKPYFDEVERMIGVRPVPWEIIGRNAEVFDRGVRALGLRGEPIERNIVGCRGCGECAFGCPSDAKQAMHLTYLPAACAAGARLYARCRVERVSIQSGCAAGVEAMLLERDGDAAHGRVRVCAPLVVVAAGAIHTPGLLARSGVRHPALGRNLRIHPAVGVAGYFAEELLAWRGTLQSYLVDRLQDS